MSIRNYYLRFFEGPCGDNVLVRSDIKLWKKRADINVFRIIRCRKINLEKLSLRKKIISKSGKQIKGYIVSWICYNHPLPGGGNTAWREYKFCKSLGKIKQKAFYVNVFNEVKIRPKTEAFEVLLSQI